MIEQSLTCLEECRTPFLNPWQIINTEHKGRDISKATKYTESEQRHLNVIKLVEIMIKSSSSSSFKFYIHYGKSFS